MFRSTLLFTTSVLVFLLAKNVLGDATALATSLSGVNAPNCGQIEAPCCLGGNVPRCADPALSCMSADGSQALRCKACGRQNQPACAGEKCGSRWGMLSVRICHAPLG